MLENLKNKVTSPEFKTMAKDIAVNVASTIVVGVAIKAVTFIAVEGTKALIEEIKNRNTDTSAE